MVHYSGKKKKTILQKVNYFGLNQKKPKRFCFGVFLLGHQPGYTFFKYGIDYNLKEFDADPEEIMLNFGKPKESYKLIETVVDGVKIDVFRREFENGIVFVNMTASDTVTKIPYSATLMNDGIQIIHAKGDVVDLPNHEALFFLKHEEL